MAKQIITMKIDFYSAKLTNWNEITVVAFSSKPNEKLYFELFENEKRIQNISIKITSLQGLNHISLKLEKDVVLGNDYVVQSNVFGLIHVDMSLATSFSDFDDRYSYDGDDLGPIYQKEKTTFAIWAPLASSVLLKYKSKSGAFCYEEMNRTKRGVFRHTLNGDNEIGRAHV